MTLSVKAMHYVSKEKANSPKLGYIMIRIAMNKSANTEVRIKIHNESLACTSF